MTTPLDKQYFDPNLQEYFKPAPIRPNTLKILEAYNFKDDANNPIQWTHGQLEILDCILHRSAPDNTTKRVEILASTRYGKSLSVAAGLVIRASLYPEQWAIVAGTQEKARVIMEYVIMLSLNNPLVRTQLVPGTPIDRLRMKKSADQLTYQRKGGVRVFSANATRVSETSKALMGFGSANIVQDESALIPDVLQATVMRMLGNEKDNFLVKIGNPFNRGHFYKTWVNGKYHRIFIDYKRAMDEGRLTQEFIEEMQQEAMFDILYECKFPPADKVDAKGWSLLLTEDEIRRAFVQNEPPFGFFRLGCDVAGGGRNYSVIVLRTYNKADLIYKENVKDTMAFAGEITRASRELGVKPDDVFIDKVGIGKGAYDRLTEQKLDGPTVTGFNAGEPAADRERFANKRAEMYWRLREWLLKGGKLEKNQDWLQLAQIKYRVNSKGQIVIMSKEEMLKEGVDSPDVADGLAHTFWSSEPVEQRFKAPASVEVTMSSLDPYAQNGR